MPTDDPILETFVRPVIPVRSFRAERERNPRPLFLERVEQALPIGSRLFVGWVSFEHDRVIRLRRFVNDRLQLIVHHRRRFVMKIGDKPGSCRTGLATGHCDRQDKHSKQADPQMVHLLVSLKSTLKGMVFIQRVVLHRFATWC